MPSFDLGLRATQILQIGVHGDELDILEPASDHPIYRVGAAAARAYYLDKGRFDLAVVIDDFNCHFFLHDSAGAWIEGHAQASDEFILQPGDELSQIGRACFLFSRRRLPPLGIQR